jgi:hypothetical protein
MTALIAVPVIIGLGAWLRWASAPCMAAYEFGKRVAAIRSQR